MHRTNTHIALLVFTLLLSPISKLFASHIAGGEMTYKYMGDTTIGSVVKQKYRVTFNLYEDCNNGQPAAILEDNPAFLAVYDDVNHLVSADSVYFITSVVLPDQLTNPCSSTDVDLCILKKIFIKDYYFIPGTTSYTISYQRCCRNTKLSNISNPGGTGITYTCTILPNIPNVNTSAVFTHYAAAIVELNNPISLDISATDADGDSLSYELCSALIGATDNNIKPWPSGPPPFEQVNYISPLSPTNPVPASVALNIDPITGLLTGKPDIAGLYLLTVCCHEWRNGVMINTVSTEFLIKFVAASSLLNPVDAGPDITIFKGDSFKFHAKGADEYTWSPTTYLDSPNIATPTGYFTEPGLFEYHVHGTKAPNCNSDDVIRVTVLDFTSFAVPSAFTPDNDGTNDYLEPYPIGKSTLKRFKIYNRWGNLVYSGGPNDFYWDGMYRGKPQDMGVYFWQLEYSDSNGKIRLQTGNVTLIR